MTFNSEVIKSDEKAVFALRSLYQKYGYKQYKMSKFEEYDLYAKNKDFLVSDQVITFTDTNGKLMALKPDVTLSIIKNSAPEALTKVYYNENVYRVSEGFRSFKEIMQTGLECIGNLDIFNICEVIMLAIESLSEIDTSFVLDISHMGLISAVLSETTADTKLQNKLLKCLAEKNLHEIKDICQNEGLSSDGLEVLASVYGDGDKVIEALNKAGFKEEAKEAVAELEKIYLFLKANDLLKNVNFDFSIAGDMKYYSGIVFKGYINGVWTSVLSGGQYSKLLSRMGRKTDAIGFAVYLDMLERLSTGAKKYDVDAVVLYDKNADTNELFKAVKKLTQSSKSVLAAKEIPDVRYRKLLKFNGKEVEILEDND